MASSSGTMERQQQPSASAGLLGRNDALADVEAHLAHRGALVVICGMGGMGKTTLASAVARRRRAAGDRVVRVRLDGSQSLDDLLDGLVLELGASLTGATVRERVVQVATVLAQERLPLIILEDFEVVAAHATQALVRWRQAAPDSAFLITSRIPVDGERRVLLHLGPLATTVDEGRSPAAELFATRAGESRRKTWGPAEWATVDAIVTALDGIPLAIELAAARLSVLTLDQLRGMLERSNDILGAPSSSAVLSRYSLPAVIEWSWVHLPVWARNGLARLSVFRGAFDLAAAESLLTDALVPTVDVLQTLVQASLLITEPRGGAMTFRLLNPVRQFISAHEPAKQDVQAGLLHLERYLLDGVEPDDLAIVLNMEDAWLQHLARHGPDYAAIARESPRAASRDRAWLRLLTTPAYRAAPLRGLKALDAIEDRFVSAPGDALADRRRVFALWALRAVTAIFASDEEAGRRAVTALGELDIGPDGGLSGFATGLFHSHISDFSRAVAEHSKVVEDEGTYPVVRYLAHVNLAMIVKDPEERRLHARASRVAELIPRSAHSDSLSSGVLALILDRPAERAERMRLLERSIEMAERTGIQAARVSSYGRFAEALHMDGALAEALERYEQARRANVGGLQPTNRSFVSGQMGLVFAEMQLFDEARPWIVDALESIYQKGLVALWRWVLLLIDAEREGAPPSASEVEQAREHMRGERTNPFAVILDAWTTIANHTGRDPSTTTRPAVLDETDGHHVARMLRRVARVMWRRHAQPADSMLVGGGRVRPPGGKVIDLRRRAVLDQIVQCLVHERLRRPGAYHSGTDLVRCVWPEEATPDSKSAQSRAQVSISRLRKLGIGAAIQGEAGGWRIDPAVDVLLVEPR